MNCYCDDCDNPDCRCPCYAAWRRRVRDELLNGSRMIGSTLSLHAACPGHEDDGDALRCLDRRVRAALEAK